MNAPTLYYAIEFCKWCVKRHVSAERETCRKDDCDGPLVQQQPLGGFDS